MKPMMPTLTFETPIGDDWRYEVKYDGFRCKLKWDKDNIELLSKYNNSLTEQFPEIISYCKKLTRTVEQLLPLTLDGELVVLENEYKGDFESIQVRGRLRTEASILEKSKTIPATFMAFDVLQVSGKDVTGQLFDKRKEKLSDIVTNVIGGDKIKLIQASSLLEDVWNKVTVHLGEGMIAKHKNSKWEMGKRTKTWYKIKNWRIVSAFITAYQKDNGFFHVAVWKGDTLLPVGLFKNGLQDQERNALIEIIRSNHTKETTDFIYVEPSIVVEIKCLELYRGQLREPYFHQFRFDVNAEDCTEEKLAQSLEPLPASVQITNPEKILWQEKGIDKLTFVQYLRTMAPYLMPFLQDRTLTVVRFPNGVHNEAFFQKNCPDYAPDFVRTRMEGDINYIVCNELETLIWLGNQASVEFHIPFETIHAHKPSEIVFDLDPPSRNEFSLAVEAAMLIKEVADGLQLQAFCKTSGNKGIQVYFPLPENTYSYEDTRAFTAFIAEYLISKEPNWFTIERLKKNRGKKLYVDYVQHGERKTIIAPYSARGNEDGLVSTPLFWEEVNESLSIEDFSIINVPARVREKGDPFAGLWEAKKEQPYGPVLEFLKGKK
ncbi:DNA ligase D [Bacillus alkalicellulosilyticus]|uniref:DNA ligase D n=1 Tax=Alkalihalobacterium alkalicellulosilyticum TaxID=1912214 RepID=UPI000996B86A|nr:DNA ligase D [Bacillus alkalicellulosilyticus]